MFSWTKYIVFLVFGLKKLVDPNESFFWSLFAPHPETDPRHNAHSLRAREGNEVQFMRPQRSGVIGCIC
ncbi:hypothetical protein R3W88_000336 [Solanum pinnatisectum]|uniref:Secreted protein n=1 Tax=Solanum pinnatisectum TaxID=50273 RepID=A0AAV9MHY4_9SOLN|nr:hypothetical protein R3W88_000336 [Solanum pinnatisectum]